jgi:hypothetical protein
MLSNTKVMNLNGYSLCQANPLVESLKDWAGDWSGVNGRLIKFFHKNWPMSHVQNPQTKPLKEGDEKH